MKICKYNNGCECEDQECDKCGWALPLEKKYTIKFTGYCEVWAKSSEEAAEKADNGDMYYVEYDFGEPVCSLEEEWDE